MGTAITVVVSKLSVKKDPLEIQHPKLENSTRFSCKIMADATFVMPPSLELSTTLLSNKC